MEGGAIGAAFAEGASGYPRGGEHKGLGTAGRDSCWVGEHEQHCVHGGCMVGAWPLAMTVADKNMYGSSARHASIATHLSEQADGRARCRDRQRSEDPHAETRRG